MHSVEPSSYGYTQDVAKHKRSVKIAQGVTESNCL